MMMDVDDDQLSDRSGGRSQSIGATSSRNAENPTIDLENYIGQFSGHMKLLRLTYIANHCVSLRVEALRLALEFVRTTRNTAKYDELFQRLTDEVERGAPAGVGGVAPGSPLLVYDRQWVEQQQKKASFDRDRHEDELKNYKSNSIKESVRRVLYELADLHLDCGDLPGVLKCYIKARDYCTSNRQLCQLYLNIMKLSIFSQDWPCVSNYIQKCTATKDFFDRDERHDTSQTAAGPSLESAPLTARLNCYSALTAMAQSRYSEAAHLFTQLDFDTVDFPELLSANCVALYGALTALASFDRRQLKDNVISNPRFKQFLELEPDVRQILQLFYESQYSTCLHLMDQIRDNLLLDMYLAPHVERLYADIRQRGLCQYFTPFMAADMVTIAAAFNTDVLQLEDELVRLILAGRLNARIDSHKKVLHAKVSEIRSDTFENVVKLGHEYQRKVKALILRTAVQRAKLEVKADSAAPAISDGAMLYDPIVT